jgi:hypothetical protein
LELEEGGRGRVASGREVRRGIEQGNGWHRWLGLELPQCVFVQRSGWVVTSEAAGCFGREGGKKS